MADSSRHGLYAIAEVTRGTTPASPAFKTIRHTGTNLGLSRASLKSEEIRPDRQLSDFRLGTKQVGGDIMTELSYGAHDDFIEAALGGTWAAKAAPYIATTISASSVDNSINDSANGLPLLYPGDKVTIAGFTGTVGNNQASLTVVSSTAAKMILSGGTAFVTDAAGESVTITTLTEQLKAGVLRRSFSVLRNFTDIADYPFHRFVGVEINTLKLSVGVSAIIKAVYGILGIDAIAPEATAPAGTTYVAAPTGSPIDSFTGSLKEGGTLIAVLTEVAMNLENGLAAKFVVGSAQSAKPSIGFSMLSGQVTAYFEDNAMLTKFINETESSLDLNSVDKAGKRIRMFIPRLKYTGGQPDTQGQSGPITLAMPFQALLDSVTGTNFIVERTP